MEPNFDLTESVVGKAVEVIDLGRVQRHGATELVARRFRVGRFEVESINSRHFERTRKITITAAGTKLLTAIVQLGRKRKIERIELVSNEDESGNWREEFLALPVLPAQINGR